MLAHQFIRLLIQGETFIRNVDSIIKNNIDIHTWKYKYKDSNMFQRFFDLPIIIIVYQRNYLFDENLHTKTTLQLQIH